MVSYPMQIKKINTIGSDLRVWIRMQHTAVVKDKGLDRKEDISTRLARITMDRETLSKDSPAASLRICLGVCLEEVDLAAAYREMRHQEKDLIFRQVLQSPLKRLPLGAKKQIRVNDKTISITIPEGIDQWFKDFIERPR